MKATKKVVENFPIETDSNTLKAQLISNLIELNEKAKEKKVKVVSANKILPLLDIRECALKQKKHPYEGLVKNNYIKNPFIEFY